MLGRVRLGAARRCAPPFETGLTPARAVGRVRLELGTGEGAGVLGVACCDAPPLGGGLEPNAPQFERVLL